LAHDALGGAAELDVLEAGVTVRARDDEVGAAVPRHLALYFLRCGGGSWAVAPVLFRPIGQGPVRHAQFGRDLLETAPAALDLRDGAAPEDFIKVPFPGFGFGSFMPFIRLLPPSPLVF
jgi:hypothetical protein